MPEYPPVDNNEPPKRLWCSVCKTQLAWAGAVCGRCERELHAAALATPRLLLDILVLLRNQSVTREIVKADYKTFTVVPDKIE